MFDPIKINLKYLIPPIYLSGTGNSGKSDSVQRVSVLFGEKDNVASMFSDCQHNGEQSRRSRDVVRKQLEQK